LGLPGSPFAHTQLVQNTKFAKSRSSDPTNSLIEFIAVHYYQHQEKEKERTTATKQQYD
jgi:hypothetical protein